MERLNKYKTVKFTRAKTLKGRDEREKIWELQPWLC